MDDLYVLKKYFGYDCYREGQEPLISSILKGQDVLGIMPTGAGKSICFQVPALVMEGITLVISPLISLMKDQVYSLNQAGIHAAYINSSLTERQIIMALEHAKMGKYKIIYVAPERLETSMFLDFVMNTKIAMITVDEAHCISQWGQDFRPSYQKIVRLIKQLPIRPIVSAFTATATTTVKEDIICILNLKNPEVVATGFDRKNLYFEIQSPKKKDTALLDCVEKHALESGIIYCSTRKNVEAVHELLTAEGIPVAKYHAGLSNEERHRNQDDFIYDTKPIIVATNAFGMGIDKSNVRFVLHYNMPQSLENYYQEAGRAGRDGEPADCVLLYSAQDVVVNRFLIHNGSSNQELSMEDMDLIKERDEERLRKMTYYCMTKNCLREHILNYFGDYGKDNCGNCSNCTTSYEEVDVTEVCKDIIACIMESGQRYGINVIVGTLRGEKRAKLISYGVVNNSNYGKRAEISEGRLKQIMNHLLMEGYLSVTNDKYALLKLNSVAKEIMQGNQLVRMKCFEEEEMVEPVARSSGKQRRSDILTSKGLNLFDKLRELRLQVAQEGNVPPYIIFSDKTLMNMCVKLPFDKEEMLQVSGVGETKYERYGEHFIECLLEFTQGIKEKYYYDSIEEEQQDSTTSTYNTKKTGRKEEFTLTKEMAEQILFSEKATLSDLVNQMNELRDDRVMKRISAAGIVRKLSEEEYIEERSASNRIEKVVLEKGREVGISVETKLSKKGNEYEVFYYSEEAQRSIVDLLLYKWREMVEIAE